MRRLVRRISGLLPFGVGMAALLLHPATAQLAWVNLAVQVVLFGLLAGIPGHLAGRVSYVDVAWPLGLVGIGVVTLLAADQLNVLTWAVAACYLLMGARMGLWGLVMSWREGWWRPGTPTPELPRYRYQRRRWERMGFRSEALSIQHAIWIQGLGNASALAVPAFLVAADPGQPLSVWSIVAIALWVGSFALESLADKQKQRFVARSEGKRGTCDVGLWRYSRHPNYFFQWMQWNALVLVALPSLLARFDDTNPVLWLMLASGLVMASYALYVTLTKGTGAKPAEFYSLQKRPEYAEYQASTNMFFPGPVTRP